MFFVIFLLCVCVCVCIYVFVFLCICVFVYVHVYICVVAHVGDKVGVTCLLGLLSTLFNEIESLNEPGSVWLATCFMNVLLTPLLIGIAGTHTSICLLCDLGNWTYACLASVLSTKPPC